MRCLLEPMKEVAHMVREHLWGIINAVVLKVSNGSAGSLNSRIKMIEVKSRGYRNRKRFITTLTSIWEVWTYIQRESTGELPYHFGRSAIISLGTS
ncbi:MAG: transposase, partial [Rhodobacteraceae bacterium]|nr:transposase [Paracoccaceae bacterium]